MLSRLLAADRGTPGYQPTYALPNAAGLLQRGNLDLKARPLVVNPDGSVSTVKSATFTDNQGHALLLPTVVGGRVVSPQQALANYQRTGQNLGLFLDNALAEAYANLLHRQQARFYGV